MQGPWRVLCGVRRLWAEMYLQELLVALLPSRKDPELCVPHGMRAGECAAVGAPSWVGREGVAKRLCFHLWVGYLMLILRLVTVLV